MSVSMMSFIELPIYAYKRIIYNFINSQFLFHSVQECQFCSLLEASQFQVCALITRGALKEQIRSPLFLSESLVLACDDLSESKVLSVS